MDFQTLYNMAANAARNAERMCSQEGGSGSGLPFQSYAGYPFYIDEYNRLLAFTTQADPTVATYLQTIDLGRDRNPADVIEDCNRDQTITVYGLDVTVRSQTGCGDAEVYLDKCAAQIDVGCAIE
jgi:hypothetical protein